MSSVSAVRGARWDNRDILEHHAAVHGRGSVPFDRPLTAAG
jgi:hypothetical protein